MNSSYGLDMHHFVNISNGFRFRIQC